MGSSPDGRARLSVVSLTRAIVLVLALPLLLGSSLLHAVVIRSRPSVAPTPTTHPRMSVPTPVPSLSTPTPVATPVRLVVAPTRSPREVSPTPLAVVRARRGGPLVRAAPEAEALALAGLYYDTYLPVYATRVDPAGVLWYQVRLWGVLSGWIRADQTEPGDPPTPTPSPSPVPAPVGVGAAPVFSPSPLLPLRASGRTNDQVNLRTGPDVGADLLTVLSPGTLVTVVGWETDAVASAWYHVRVDGQEGWLWAGGVNLATPDPTRTLVDGRPLWTRVAGKGMWMPYPLIEMASPDAVVSAARQLGLTHIYLEVGDSRRGFYGRPGVDRLLMAAHQAHLAVIGWVMTSLADLPTDVRLCTAIATYRTPDGQQLDGIAPDIEENMTAADVAAFSQILRSTLGPERLIVGVIYPAGSWIGRQYPIASILSQTFNALAPMAYWHDARRPFSAAEVTEVVRHAVLDIHAAVGNDQYPVTVIGQSYDPFSRNGAGPNNPTGAEITAALQAAQEAGAVGISLFQWGTTTPPEWDALRAFHWSP
jgi:hypothetical protein